MPVRPVAPPIPLAAVPKLLAGRGVQVSANRLQALVVAGVIPSRLEGSRRVFDEADLDAIAAYIRDHPMLPYRQGAAARAQAGKR